MSKSVSRSQTCNETRTTVITDSATDSTTTCTNNRSTVKTSAASASIIPCPCKRLDLPRLVEETRCWAFQSSNLAAAHCNASLVFAMTILQELLMQTCSNDEVNINDIILIAVAIAELGEVLKIYNPTPFNS